MGDRLYVVVDGEVEVIREEPGKPATVLASFQPGECFGEMALVADNPRNTTARTRTRVNVLTVDRAAFHALFVHLPPLRSVIQMLIEERLKSEQTLATAAGTPGGSGDAGAQPAGRPEGEGR